METEEASLEAGNREPTIEEWQAILIWIFDENPIVQGAIEYFLRRSKSGKAYLKGAKRLRPELDIDEDLDLAEITMTYDAMKLVCQLIEEPRCGSDPTFWVWKDIWKDSGLGVSEYYEPAIEISRTLESRSKDKAERTRLRQVRAALENELSLETRFEEYRMFREEADADNPKL